MNIIFILFAIFWCGTLLTVIAYKKDILKLTSGRDMIERLALDGLAALGTVVICCAVIALLYFCREKNVLRRLESLSDRNFTWLLCGMSLVVFIVQFICMIFISKPIGKDFQVLHETADSIVMDGTFIEDEYFSRYTNNLNILFIFTLILKIFRHWKAVVAVGVLLINLSVLCVAQITAKLTGSRRVALLIFVIGIVLYDFAYRTFVPYTDNYGALFGILPIFFVVNRNHKFLRKTWVIFAALSFAIGLFIKVTIAIIGIAAVILYLIYLKRSDLRRDWKKILVAFVSIVACFALLTGCRTAYFQSVGFDYNENASFSLTHWFMMGQNNTNYGSYLLSDVGFSDSFDDPSERNAANLKIGFERIRDRGVVKNIVFYVYKNCRIYYDGLFQTAQSFVLDANYTDTIFTDFMTFDGKFYTVYEAVEQILWALVQAFILVVVISRKRKDKFSVFAYTAILGVSAYTLLFEGRAKYLFMFIPLYLLLAGIGISSIPHRKQKALSTEGGGSRMTTLYIVMPCYNEQEVLPETSRRIAEKMHALQETEKISQESRVVFVDDGSKDHTWSIIESLHNENTLFQGIKLSRNRGHQNALLAGLMTVKDKCDAVISLDADLQDDMNAIDEMLEKFIAGNDIVYGVRSARDTDTFFKLTTAEGYYKAMNFLGADTVYNHADYRLMSRRALDGLESFPEVNLFLRGMVPLVGYKSDIVYYERHERFAGESKYPFRKMISFAWEGITSLTIQPLKLILWLGLILFLGAIIFLIYAIVRHACGNTISGWTSLIVSIWGIGGLQMFAIGILGQYIGKVYLESKRRPKFIVEEYLS